MEYFNTHGNTYSLKDFINIEVEERSNYTKEEIDRWVLKYNIDVQDKCIWVSPDISILKKYYELDEYNYFTFSDSDGFIIPESDDGDSGYLFILRRKI